MKAKTTPPFKEEYSSPELYVLNWNYQESVLQGSFDDEENYGDDWN